MDFDLETQHQGIDKDTPPSEVARKLIRPIVNPYIELEKKGYVDGLRIVITGSLVNQLIRPNDYDILILYDDYIDKGKKDRDDLSENAKMAMNRLVGSGKNAYGQYTTLFSFSDADFPYAGLADIEISSTHNFLKHLNASENEKKREALQQLFRHTEVIYRKAVPDNRILDSNPGIDFETIDKIVLYSLIMARGFKYELTFEDINNLAKYSHSFCFPNETDNQDKIKLAEQYLEENMHKLLNKEQIEKFKIGVQGDVLKTLAVLGELTSSFVDNTNLSPKFKDRVLWIFGLLKNDLNGEELAVQDGHLVYGEKLTNNGKSVFIEDDEFLKI